MEVPVFEAMASSSNSSSETESRGTQPLPIEQRTQTLKDFLGDDLSSCSSNSFRSLSRQSSCTTVRNLLDMDIEASDSSHAPKLLRSRSKAASTTISTLQKASEALINVVKHLPFSTLKPLSSQQNQAKLEILPRSLSWRLGRFSKKSEKVDCKRKVRNIVWWRSFRDYIQDNQQPMNNSDSWCDSFEYSGENEAEKGKKNLPEKRKKKKNIHKVGKDSMGTTTNSVDAKGEYPYNEKEQFSPVSVLDFPYKEEEDDEDDEETQTETSSSFHQILANLERTKKKLMKKIRRFESLAQLEPVNLETRNASLEFDGSGECQEDEDEEEQEEDKEAMETEKRAIELMKLIKATSSMENRKGNMDRVLLDFFRDELMERKTTRSEETECNGFDYGLLKVARDWMNGHHCGSSRWGLEYIQKANVKDMESGGRGRKFVGEQGELATELEVGVLGSLVDELLLDLLS